MTSRFLALFLLLISLVIFPSIVAAHEKKHDHDNFKTPFEFLKHLQGCRKGDKAQDILKLKLYLKKFGYLRHNELGVGVLGANDFDGLLEAALRTYQLNYGLKPTGRLDTETVAKMSIPRCGVPDIINGTNWMRFGKKGRGRGHLSHHRGNAFGSFSFHVVSHYNFFRGNLKWPASKYHLTYAFDSGTPEAAVGAIARAFKTWSSATHFTFSQVTDINKSDIKIDFRKRDHEDGPFDGQGGVLAHATAPTGGLLHFDADDGWAVGSIPDRVDIETVAVHEIGHILGLEHSSDPKAIMYPSVSTGITKGLSNDDIQGIMALYNV